MLKPVFVREEPSTPRHPVPSRVPVLSSMVALAFVLAATPALAQSHGKVQVTARVLLTEPSRSAWDGVRAARSAPPTALFRVRDTGWRERPVAAGPVGPRRIITIEFLQN